jgi:hypothetical protein
MKLVGTAHGQSLAKCCLIILEKSNLLMLLCENKDYFAYPVNIRQSSKLY